MDCCDGRFDLARRLRQASKQTSQSVGLDSLDERQAISRGEITDVRDW